MTPSKWEHTKELTVPLLGWALSRGDPSKCRYLLALVLDESYGDSGGRVSTVSVCL